MTGLPWYRVPAALVDACETASTLTEREAVLDLCARVWIGDEPSRSGLQCGDARVTHGQLADAWGWSRHKVRSFLRKLENTSEISTLGEGRATIVRLTQLRRNLDATLTQPRRKRIQENQEVTGRDDATLTQTRRNRDATATHYIEREKKQETRYEIKTPQASPAVAAVAAPVDEGRGEVVAVVDLSTKAGRSRAFPPLSSLPRSGTRYEYPPAYVAFRDAYPDAAKRAPAPATYQDWRALVVGGVDPDTLERAARAHAIESGGKFARRCHGPSGWLRAGDWEGYASGPARRPNPVSEQIAESPLEVDSVTPIAPLPETGCAQWEAIRDRLSATVPPLAPSLRACVGEVDGETLRLRTRDEMAVLVLRGKLPTLAPGLEFDLRLVD